MPSISYTRDVGDDYVTEEIDTGNQVATVVGHIPAARARLTLQDGQVLNDGADIETVTVSLVSGLQVAQGTDPDAADVLADEAGTLTVEIDGTPIDLTLTDGSATKQVTTTKAAGDEVTVRAMGYDAAPIERDAATIEVVSA